MTNLRWTRGFMVLGMGGLLLVGPGMVGAAKDQTVGERFRKAIEREAEYCATHRIKPTNRRCDITKLKPADPLATEEGRFAHSIKIPNPVPSDSGYKPGMTSQEYFDHLCKTEAGEFIFKTVENIEGLYMMRPRKEATDDELSHLYALEDPYGQVLSESELPQDEYIQPAMGKYEFLEMPRIIPPAQAGTTDKYKRYYRDANAHPNRRFQTAINGQGVFVPYIVAETNVQTIKSRYGYTWRGISRPHDREFGITGGEIIVLDLQTQEVLAVRRGFLQSGWMKNLTGIWWLTGRTCRPPGAKREHLFIKGILKPVTATASSKEK